MVLKFQEIFVLSFDRSFQMTNKHFYFIWAGGTDIHMKIFESTSWKGGTADAGGKKLSIIIYSSTQKKN